MSLSPALASPPVWKGALGGGLSMTGGNTDTNSYSVDFAVIRDPKKKDVFKADGFYLRTDTDGEAAVDRTGLGARYERALGKSARAFAFGEVRYLRDVFKDVDHLITPTVGAGYRFLDGERVKLSADAGIGLAFEQLAEQEATTDGAVSASENLLWKLGANASFVHAGRALWKIDDFGDAYYHLDAGIRGPGPPLRPQAHLRGRLQDASAPGKEEERHRGPGHDRVQDRRRAVIPCAPLWEKRRRSATTRKSRRARARRRAG